MKKIALLSSLLMIKISTALAQVPIKTNNDPFKKTDDLLTWATESLTGIIGGISIVIFLVCSILTIFGSFPKRWLIQVVIGAIMATSSTFIAEKLFGG